MNVAYTDVKIYLALLIVSSLLVLSPVLYGYFLPNPLYTGPIERGEVAKRLFRLIHPGSTDKPEKTFGMALEKIKDKFSTDEEFFKAMSTYKGLTLWNLFKNFLFSNRNIDQHAMCNAIYRIYISVLQKKDISLSPIKKYLYKIYEVDDYKEKNGDDADLREYFKTKYNEDPLDE